MTDPLPPLDCETAMRRLWAWLDGALPELDAEQVRAHVETCVHCRPHADFERRFLAELRALRGETGDPARLRARVLDALRAAGWSS